MSRYVEQRDGGYWITGTRVSLDTAVYAFLRGAAPESIAQSVPSVTLEQVYGAIAFYLSHRDEIDAYLGQGDVDFEEMRKEARAANPLLYRKLEAAKNKSLAD